MRGALIPTLPTGASKRVDVASSSDDITGWLGRWHDGDEAALENLVPLVYQELHRLASRYMRGERSGHLLQTSALVNEAYLRLREVNGIRWQDRHHFYAVAARAMRRILVDFARARKQQKRNAERQVSFDEALTAGKGRSADVVALDDALRALAKLDRRQSQIVELRFFGGLTEPHIARVLGVSPRTVSSEWRLARSWLLRELNGDITRDA
jgi:RNA polymerase sigma factor (TIGR02999 family)